MHRNFRNCVLGEIPRDNQNLSPAILNGINLDKPLPQMHRHLAGQGRPHNLISMVNSWRNKKVSELFSTKKPGIWHWEGMTLATLLGSGLFLWPFLSFGAIFMFDSPIQSRSDLVNRCTIAYFIWFYPITYAATCLSYYLLRRRGVWRSLSIVAWGLPVVAFFILPDIAGWRNPEKLNFKRVQLLYRTDHAALLAACREVMTNRKTFSDISGSTDPSRTSIDPKNHQLPEAIIALQPRYIIAEDDKVFLQLYAGIATCGVSAYSEKAANSHTNASAKLLLLPGLWFHDDELGYQLTDRDKYMNKLKAMNSNDATNPN